MTRDVPPALSIPAHLHARQATASDPEISVWVSANAGSGKTHVLTQRVIRLLLGGVAPAKILCLTFTKAAAAQMAQRVFDTLSRWTQHNDSELREAILATGAPVPTHTDLLRARRLFTRTVETPGGLKIQTIHAFCERLLHLFPFEANVSAQFEVADDRRTQEMLSLARRAAIADLKDSEPLAVVADVVGQDRVTLLIAQAMRARGLARRAGCDPQKELGAVLGADGFASADAVRRAMIEDGLGPGRWPGIADILDTGLRSDQTNAQRLRKAAALCPPLRSAAERGRGTAQRAVEGAAASRPSNGPLETHQSTYTRTGPLHHASHGPPPPSSTGEDERGNVADVLDVYLPIFFDKEGNSRNRLLTKRLAEAHPTLHADLQAEQGRLAALRETLKAAITVERTNGLVDLVDAVLDRYDQAKTAQGLLDFDDLIDKTLTMLDRSDAGWVLHKLDAGIDHVLVDEAQDTSEAQWKILEQLTGDFAAGETARSTDRSFFAVGDEKQSIFSFQGAAPQMFDEMRSAFERRFKHGDKRFERVPLTTSFRSVQGILDAVDKVFESDAHRDGLVPTQEHWQPHDAVKARLPGLIEIWPRIGATETDNPSDWSIPVDVPAEKDPVNILAERVAKTIKALTAPDSPERVHDGRSGTPRRIRPGDILVLVRTRGTFFEAVIRALKQNYVDVAGADRLDVANHIAVMDLVAAGRTALLPADDLSLACLLKSPLFGLTDDDLIALAPNRTGSLFSALGASDDPRHRETHAAIRRWSARAPAVTPFAFYVELLGRDGGRRLMESRLGPEAHDAIDEFLRLALAHEQQGAPSLGSFLSDVEALESSIKRDMEAPGNAVRVMTVHAAKGLEAKVVFLPDTCAVPAQQLDPNVFDLNKGTGRPPLLAWSPRKGDDPSPVAQARATERQAAMREYRRLLYVALTRAEERLYLAGFYNVREPPDDCWERMIDRAFPEAQEVAAPWEDGAGEGETIKRIVSPGSLGETMLAAPLAREQRALPLPPNWLSEPVAAPAPYAALRPSKLSTRPARAEQRRGLDYGSALHLLLQYLPSVAPEDREGRARAFLAAREATIPADTHDRLLAEALAVFALPTLAPLFVAGAKAEVPIIGRLVRPDGTQQPVRGAVDRLVMTPEGVLVADFKSGVPQTPVPDSYKQQMALYRRVLAGLWPRQNIRMLLVWTQTPEIVELPATDLDAVADAVLSRGTRDA